MAGLVLATLGVAPAAALNEKLSNGVTLQTVHPAGAETIAIRLLVPAGGRDDPRGSEGLAHYVEHLVASGPGPLDPGGLKLSAHGYANAYTSPTVTVYVMDVSPESLESGLSLLAERLSRLAAGEAVALREQRIVLQEYSMRAGNNPAMRLMTELRVKLGRTDAALGLTIGMPESIKTLDLAMARAFFDRWYRPETMALVLAGPVDLDTVAEVAERTIGAIPARPTLSRSPGGAPPLPAPVTVERNDPDAAVPIVLCHFFIRAIAAPPANVMKEHAAMLALQILFVGAKEGPVGLLAGLRVGRKDVRAISAGVARLDRRWLQLGMAAESDPAASQTAIASLLTRRLANLTERDVPDKLLTQLRDLADQTWLVAEDAPSADAVIEWLRLGFTIEERSHLRTALMSLTKKDIAAFARKIATPATSATVFLRPTQ
jgi:zinc protease